MHADGQGTVAFFLAVTSLKEQWTHDTQSTERQEKRALMTGKCFPETENLTCANFTHLQAYNQNIDKERIREYPYISPIGKFLVVLVDLGSFPQVKRQKSPKMLLVIAYRQPCHFGKIWRIFGEMLR